MGMSTSPGRPPPPSANSTTGSRCSQRDAEQAVGLLVVAHALRAGEHGGVVGHDDGARPLGAERVAALTLPMPVTMPSAGVLRIRSSSSRRLLLRREGERAVLDEAAGIAEVGDVLARGAQAEGMALGDRLGPARVGEQRLARAQLEQVGAQRPRAGVAAAAPPQAGAAASAGRSAAQHRRLASTTSPTPQRSASTTPSLAARTSCSIFIDSTTAISAPRAHAARRPRRRPRRRCRRAGRRCPCGAMARRLRPAAHRARIAVDRQAVEVDARRRARDHVGHHPRRCRRPWSSRACRGRWRGRGCRSASAPITGVPSGVIGRRPHQNSARADVAAAGKEIVDDVRQRLPARLVQAQACSRRARRCRRRGCGRRGASPRPCASRPSPSIRARRRRR